MRRLVTPALGLALSLVASNVGAQQVATSLREYRIDAGHSQVGFAIGFLGHPVRGRFDDVRGTIVYTPGRPSASAITVAIATASINTGSKRRDEHLRSADFFDAATFPYIVFQSRAIAPAAHGFVATGALTMRGVTREVAIPFREPAPAVADPHGSSIVFFTGALRLARKDFGILGGSKHNDWFDAIRSATMADSVDVTLEVQGWTTDFDRVRRYDATIARIERDGTTDMVAYAHTLRAQPADSIAGAAWELDQLAQALLARGRVGDGVALLRAGVDLSPRSAAAHASLARGLELAGDRAAALASAERALALDQTETRAHELRRRLR